MSVKISKGKVARSLSMTPLIDVVFLLLIFFLVATKFEEEEKEMQVLLPEANEAAPSVERVSDLFVNVDETGRYFVTGQVVNATQLQQILSQRAANNPGRQRVVIRADRRCRWEYVVAVMDFCNRAQIRDYVVSTAGDA